MQNNLESWIIKAIEGHNISGIRKNTLIDFIDYFNREAVNEKEVDSILKDLQKNSKVKVENDAYYMA
jgi:hypothetical protein